MRLSAQGLWDNYTADNAYPSVTPAETWDPATGVETAVAPLNPAALAEIANYNHCMARDIQVQNDYAGNFNVGGVSIKPLVGWEYEQFEITEWAIRDPNLPQANILGQSDGAAYTPYNPPHPAVYRLHDFCRQFAGERVVRSRLRPGPVGCVRRPAVFYRLLLPELGGSERL